MIQIASQETNVSPRMLWGVTGCFFRWRIIERKQAQKSGDLGPGVPPSSSLLLLKAAYPLCVTTSLSMHLDNLLHTIENLKRQCLVKYFEKSNVLYKHEKSLPRYVYMVTSLLLTRCLTLVFQGAVEIIKISLAGITCCQSLHCASPTWNTYFFYDPWLHSVGCLSVSPVT